MYITPSHLEEITQQYRARVPSLGLGFEKASLDNDIHQKLLNHFRDNQRNFRAEKSNDWLKTENDSCHPSLVYQDVSFNGEIGKLLKSRHEAWSGQQLVDTACFGIRVYQSGSYLFNHVDTVATHVVSSTICVDHRLNQPWPLYIEDENGAHEISIKPGEMVFYESARLLHGRPHPLDGDYYAGLFVHYAPVDWKLI